MLTLTANIVQCDGMGFTGWIEEVKGVVAQGDTLEDVKAELLKVLQIKLKIELGIKAKTASSPEEAEENVIKEYFNITVTHNHNDVSQLQAG